MHQRLDERIRNDNRGRSRHRQRAVVQILLITLAILLAPIVTASAQADATAEPTVDLTPVIPPTPEPTVPPTPTAELTPLPTSTPEPTIPATPHPTEPTKPVPPEPTETATPIVDPSATASPTPASEPAATPVPEPTAAPTPTPTPTPAPRARISPQAVISGTGCRQTSQSDIVEPLNGSVTFSCSSVSSWLTQYQRVISPPTAGWQYSVNGGTWTDQRSTRDGGGAFTIALRATSNVLPGAPGTVTIETQRCSIWLLVCLGWDTVDTTIIQARAANPSATHLGISCTPPDSGVGSGATGTVTCWITGHRMLEAPVKITGITVAVPNDWQAGSSDGELGSGSLVIPFDPGLTIGPSDSHEVLFRISPMCTAPRTAATFTVSSTFQYGATSYAGPGTSFEAEVSGTSAPPSVTASLVGGEMVPLLPFSYAPQAVDSGVGIQVANPERCVGWNVKIQASGLAYSGVAPGQEDLPVSSIHVVQPDGERLVLSDQPQRLISDGGPDEQYAFAIELIVPGGAASGAYTGTVTIETSAAPET